MSQQRSMDVMASSARPLNICGQSGEPQIAGLRERKADTCTLAGSGGSILPADNHVRLRPSVPSGEPKRLPDLQLLQLGSGDMDLPRTGLIGGTYQTEK